jgi:hypothetical protein
LRKVKTLKQIVIEYQQNLIRNLANIRNGLLKHLSCL